MFGAIGALFISLIIGALFQPLTLNEHFATQKFGEPFYEAKNILLVTAHPDDEAMFFAPTITAVTSNPELALYHVCMSTGDAEGLGVKRRAELEKSVDILGLKANQSWIVDHPKLRDGMTTEWDPELIASLLDPYALKNNIDTILTFDSHGVSGHKNHIALHHGAAALTRNLAKTSPKPPVRLLSLLSEALPFKYISILSSTLGKIELYWYKFRYPVEELIIQLIALSDPSILNPKFPRHRDGGHMPAFISGYEGYLTAVKAMKAHESQLEWFRWLYLGTSRFMWVNTWQKYELEVPVDSESASS